MKTHGCVISTVTADVLVLKHQDISIYSADEAVVVFGSVSLKNTLTENKVRN